ncbi:MAG TPA: DUF4388 domain-containing protein [Gemmatimonadales bacterium]|nr:DUF4388 domain-containing protein [Gemmatimonadales bacterium]
MPIQGNLEEAGLADVLQLLALGRKSGCLTLVDGEMQGHIYLDVGRVSYATVANRLDRLGDMLVRSGRITQQQLDSAVDEQRRSSKRQIGRILVDSGRIDRGELERFIKLQVEQAVYFLFTWKQGNFTFTTDRLPPHQPLLVSLDVEGLLLEGARQVDEWSQIEKKIPSFDLIYRCIRDKLGATAESLTDEQKRILPLLDGSRELTAIVEETALSEFEVGKALYGLVTAGIVHLVERRSHIRHLEYRDLLAYVVREAEFADPVLRKEAARHIVDCAQCAERLRTIHVRQTAGVDAAAIEEQAEAEAPAVAPPQAVAHRATGALRAVAGGAAVPPTIQRAAVPHPAPDRSFADRRAGRERRVGHDRRGVERRAGPDRRRAVGLAPVPPNMERRQAPRRAADRRSAPSRDRRTSEPAIRPGDAAATAPGPSTGRGGPRRGEFTPRRDIEPVPGAPQHGDNGAGRVAASGDATAAAEAQPAPVAAAAGAAEAKPTTPEAAPPAAPPAQGSEVQAIDLAWLVTPDQSLEMIRGARAQARAVPPAAGGAAPAAGAGASAAAGSGAAPAGGPGVAQTRATDAPGARPPIERRATTAGVRMATGPAPDGSALRAESRKLERFRAGADVGAEAGKPSPAVRQAFPLRSLAIAAVIAVVALVGYVAGRIAKGGRAPRLSDVADVQSLAQAAAPPAQPAPVPATPAPAQTPRATTHPAPAQTTAAPPRSSRPAPVRTAAASPRPVTPAAPPVVAPPAPQPAPTVGIVRGVVHDAAGGAIAGARVAVRGTALSAVADGSGAFEIRDVPPGAAALQASADGYMPGGAQAQVTAGGTVAADVTMNRVPPRVAVTCGADRELAAGGWAPIDRAAATSTLGGTLGAIPGLSIESITASTSGPRTRVRVAQVTAGCERIVLTETRAGANVRGGTGPAVVTALRVMPASEAYPYATGSASFGNILVTVKTGMSADSLRPLLSRLNEISEGQ